MSASQLAADGVVVLHVLFIVFAVLGGFAVLRWPKLIWLHLPCAGWAAAVELMGWYCPLTPLENLLRRAADEGAYVGGFIEHYVMPILYPPGLTRDTQVLLGSIVVVLNLIAYALVVTRHRRARRARATERS